MNASWNGRHDARRWPPRSAPAARACVDATARVVGCAARATCDVDALVAHHLVHEPEAAQRLRIGEQQCSSPSASRSLTCRASVDRLLGRLPQMLGQVRGRRVLLVEPGPVAVDERRAAPTRSSVAVASASASMSAARRRPPGRRSAGSRATGSQVVHTAVARRAPSATSQSTEQVRPTANSSRLRYCRSSRRSSSSCSQPVLGPARRHRQEHRRAAGVDRTAWSGTSMRHRDRRGVSRSLHSAISPAAGSGRRRSGRPAATTSSLSGTVLVSSVGQVGDRDGARSLPTGVRW